ncbi:MAG: gamma carbonic anhydrase family protein [Actinomycetota bacterium]|nr:gamma carbonic anhydrase family protein [Actinomycetota bacterium]
MIIEIDGKKPKVALDAFVAPTAVLIGDVIVESRASVWWGAVVRADWNTISIGARSSIQDNCVIHCTREKGVKVGRDVTVGHAAVLHSCEVRDSSLIGMHATVLDGAVIGEGAVVSAGSVVTPRTRVESGILVGGVPARPMKELSREAKLEFEAGKKMYEELAQKYLSLGL